MPLQKHNYFKFQHQNALFYWTGVMKTVSQKKLSLVLISSSFTNWNFLTTVFKFYRKEDMQKNKKAQKKNRTKRAMRFP